MHMYLWLKVLQVVPVPTQPRYIQQQPPTVYYHDTVPGFYPYQQSYDGAVSQWLPWEQYSGPVWHHPYQPAAHMIPMNTATNAGMPPTMMPDNNGMVLTTKPHMHSPNVHHHTTMVQLPVPSMATKQSKAIKIVNPETMREVDTSKLKKIPPTSSAYLTTNPISEVQQQSKQTVEEVIIEPIEKANSIQQINKQFLEIQNVMQKPEDVSIKILKGVEDLDSHGECA